MIKLLWLLAKTKVLFHFQLAINSLYARNAASDFFNPISLLLHLDRTSQSYVSVLRDDLAVLCIGRHFGIDNALPNARCNADVHLVFILIQRCLGIGVARLPSQAIDSCFVYIFIFLLGPVILKICFREKQRVCQNLFFGMNQRIFRLLFLMIDHSVGSAIS